MDTLVFASLMGLYYWFARLRLGYTFSAMLLQPVVIAVLSACCWAIWKRR